MRFLVKSLLSFRNFQLLFWTAPKNEVKLEVSVGRFFSDKIDPNRLYIGALASPKTTIRGVAGPREPLAVAKTRLRSSPSHLASRLSGDNGVSKALVGQPQPTAVLYSRTQQSWLPSSRGCYIRKFFPYASMLCIGCYRDPERWS